MTAKFFSTLEIPTLGDNTEWSCRVIPLYIRKIPAPQLGNDRFISYYLADVATTQRRAVWIVTLTQDVTKTTWQLELTREDVMDKTVEAMRTVMLHNVKYNPLRR